MASRPTTRSGRCYVQRARDRLRANRIAQRLVAFALSENDPVTKRPVMMTASQVRAAQILLNKVLPDLKAVEVRDVAPQDAIAQLLEAVMDHNQQLRTGGAAAGRCTERRGVLSAAPPDSGQRGRRPGMLV